MNKVGEKVFRTHFGYFPVRFCYPIDLSIDLFLTLVWQIGIPSAALSAFRFFWCNTLQSYAAFRDVKPRRQGRMSK